MKGFFGSETCRAGVKSGESTLREVAAYLIDYNGFSGVPATSLVELKHESLPSTLIEEDQLENSEHLDLISGMIPHKNNAPVYEAFQDCEEISEVSETSMSTNSEDEQISQLSHYTQKNIPKVGSL